MAAGWDRVTIEELPVARSLRDGLLHLTIEDRAPRLRVATAVDAAAFDEAWLAAVLRAAG